MSELDLSLVLPGTIPGLLRRGSPVVFLSEDAGNGHIYPKGTMAVVDRMQDTEPRINGRSVFPSIIGLDLTDATGRMHACWWWRITLHPNLEWRANPEWGGGYSLEGLSGYLGDGRYRALLADLSPNDERRLPDGSRWVHAEAVRRVCLHIEASR